MQFSQSKKNFIYPLIWLCLFFFWPICLAAQDDTGTGIRNTVSKTLDVEKKIQKKQEDWAKEEADISTSLSVARSELERYEARKEKLVRLKNLEEKKHIEFLRKKKEINRLQNELNQFLESVLVRLDQHFESDLPFLKWERSQRLTALKDLLADPAESPAEKYRRIFNALQIETEYGSTVEVTQDTISLDGTDVMADLLRIGRLSLFCQTIDKQKSAVFNPYENLWQVLPESVNQDISDAIAMAKLERTVEIVALPFGRILSK